ncbi:MAG: hypothetical protein HeimC3_09090 [Candidatus Heimdallarchaeota archaeon LC_3]|nr:MAG: hypothetical protein HeimC3_09090 [Candidatus Heimdallarchaeota archaeon LC_3]
MFRTNDFINQQKTLNLNSSIVLITESLKTMEENLTKQFQQLEKSLMQKIDEKISKLLENPTEI